MARPSSSSPKRGVRMMAERMALLWSIQKGGKPNSNFPFSLIRTHLTYKFRLEIHRALFFHSSLHSRHSSALPVRLQVFILISQFFHSPHNGLEKTLKESELLIRANEVTEENGWFTSSITIANTFNIKHSLKTNISFRISQTRVQNRD